MNTKKVAKVAKGLATFLSTGGTRVSFGWSGGQDRDPPIYESGEEVRPWVAI